MLEASYWCYGIICRPLFKVIAKDTPDVAWMLFPSPISPKILVTRNHVLNVHLHLGARNASLSSKSCGTSAAAQPMQKSYSPSIIYHNAFIFARKDVGSSILSTGCIVLRETAVKAAISTMATPQR